MFDRRTGARLRRNKTALVGLVIVGTLVLFAAFGPALATRSAYESDFVHGMTVEMSPVGPSAHFPLGTDVLYRDQLARLATGARLSLLIALCATAIASAIGAAVGIVAGYYEGSEGVPIPWASVGACAGAAALLVRGHPWLAALALGAAVFGGAALAHAPRARRWRWLRGGVRLDADAVLMRLVDVGLSFPFLLLVMSIGAAMEKTSAATILTVLGLTGWLGTARVLRAKTLVVRNLEFVVASKALGQRTAAILARHVLPNVLGPLIVLATASVAQMIIAESVLSYLGVGIAPPTPTWGRMLFEGQLYYELAPWLLIAPAAAILLSVFGFNLLGEGLRDALDPRDE